MTPEYKVAFLRAIIAGLVLGGAMFFTMLAQTESWRLIASATGVAFFGPLVIRFGGEGTVDSRKAAATPDSRPVAPGGAVADVMRPSDLHADWRKQAIEDATEPKKD